MLRAYPIGLRGPWLLLLLGGLVCTFGAVIQRVTGPDESEITHASGGGGVSARRTKSVGQGGDSTAAAVRMCVRKRVCAYVSECVCVCM